jgi:dTMP kinase
MKKGFFLVLEGVDGSGKSTQAKMLGEYLRENGYDVVHTAEPTSGFIGQTIRMALSGKMELAPRTLSLLFTADRSEHVDKVISPAIGEGKIVICERYYYSTLAYQSVQGVNPQWILESNSFAPEPDLVILLEIDPEKALPRINRDREVFEVIDFQKAVQKELLEFSYRGYKKFGNRVKKQWKTVDASKSVDEVQALLRDTVDAQLSKM